MADQASEPVNIIYPYIHFVYSILHVYSLNILVYSIKYTLYTTISLYKLKLSSYPSIQNVKITEIGLMSQVCLIAGMSYRYAIEKLYHIIRPPKMKDDHNLITI